MLHTAGPWTLGWDAIVAIGTLTLAVVTFRVPSKTSRLAEETRGLADATQADVAAQCRPIVAPARFSLQAGGSPPALTYLMAEGDCTVFLTNIGHEPALNVGVWYIGDHPRHNPSSDPGATALAVNCAPERVTIRHPIRPNADGGFNVQVQYSSIAGDRYHSEIAYVAGREPGELVANLVKVTRLYHKSPDDSTD